MDYGTLTIRGAGALLCVAAVLCIGAAPASAARTWAGTWSTTWQGSPGGEVMELNEAGYGTFENGRGTIVGGVNGNENRGTWQTPTASGTFMFTLTGDGLGFSGQGAQNEIPFPWHGYCTAGPCLNNAALFDAAEGTYRGASTDNGKVRFTVADGDVTDFHWDIGNPKKACSLSGDPTNQVAKINKDGGFRFKYYEPTLKIAGKFVSKNKVKGTLVYHTKPTPSHPQPCEKITAEYTAKRK